MLTILHDPAGITGSTSYPLDYTASLQENIERHLDGGAGCELRINGMVVDPLTDARMDRPPSVLDRVTVIRRPEGIEWVVFAVAAALAIAAYTMIPKPPEMATQQDSPNNKLTAQTNLARTYQAVPDVYGNRRVWPDLIQPSVIEYIDNLKYVTETLCIGRGKGTITNVSFADTPIADIDGSSYEVFEPVPSGGYPEFGTTTVSDVLEQFASPEVNGQEISFGTALATLEKSGDIEGLDGETTFTVTFANGSDLDDLKSISPGGQARVSAVALLDEWCTLTGYTVIGGNTEFAFTKSGAGWIGDISTTASFTVIPYQATTVGPFTMPIDCSRLWWNLAFLRGLNRSVEIKAEWWKVDVDGVEVPGTRQSQTNTYTADTLDQQFRTVKVTPTAGNGRYRIQFQRLTPPTDDSSAAEQAKLEAVNAVRYYANKQFPGVTILRVTTKATLSATGFRDRKFNLYWLRHVRTLTSSTISASRNFARIMAHIWTLAGEDMADMDTEAMAAINSELGETSQLLRFDGSLDDADMSLGERMQLVANMARCVVWRDGTKWTVTRDQARDVPELQLDYRNLAAGGDSTIGYAAHLPASNDGVEVEYVDETTQAKKSYERLVITSGAPVAGEPTNPKKFKMAGCATQVQAQNRAQLEARRLLYQRVSVSDMALRDGSVLGVGALVRWIDPNDFAGDDGLQAGEVLAIDGLTITTSEALDWKGETSGRILLTGANGMYLGSPIVCTPGADDRSVTLASMPAGAYVADADRQLGSRYAFAVGLTQAEMEAAGLYTVTEARPAADGKVALSLAQYDERIYAAD